MRSIKMNAINFLECDQACGLLLWIPGLGSHQQLSRWASSQHLSSSPSTWASVNIVISRVACLTKPWIRPVKRNMYLDQSHSQVLTKFVGNVTTETIHSTMIPGVLSHKMALWKILQSAWLKPWNAGTSPQPIYLLQFHGTSRVCRTFRGLPRLWSWSD